MLNNHKTLALWQVGTRLAKHETAVRFGISTGSTGSSTLMHNYVQRQMENSNCWQKSQTELGAERLCRFS